MENLSKSYLQSRAKINENYTVGTLNDMPERIIQFGEGNFLRGFIDWMVDTLNKQGLFNGKVVIVQPINRGLVKELNSQDGLYTLLLRGLQNGSVVEKKSIITSVSRGIDPYADFKAYLKCAENPDMRFVISNTTEAGIAYNDDDKLDDEPPASYPGKLTVFLYKRFTYFKGEKSKGMVIIPCELIEQNGKTLKKVIVKLAEKWNLGSGFIDWINNSNYFMNTLVDRIVSGYPRDEIEKLTAEMGYNDNLIDAAEIFHLFVIEGDKAKAQELPLHKAGLNVIYTDNQTPYRTRKVRILNGAHTMTVLGAYLYGKDTVGQCMDDEIISSFMRKGITEEVIPTLDLPEKELTDFASAVFERFSNPFVEHMLMSISLNSTSKFKVRVLPSLLAYNKLKGELPDILTFSFAELIAFYKGTEIKDNALIGNRNGKEYKTSDNLDVLTMFRDLWASCYGSKSGIEKLVGEVLKRSDIWGEDLNDVSGLTQKISGYLYEIETNGIEDAIKAIIR